MLMNEEIKKIEQLLITLDNDNIELASQLIKSLGIANPLKDIDLLRDIHTSMYGWENNINRPIEYVLKSFKHVINTFENDCITIDVINKNNELYKKLNLHNNKEIHVLKYHNHNTNNEQIDISMLKDWKYLDYFDIQYFDIEVIHVVLNNLDNIKNININYGDINLTELIQLKEMYPRMKRIELGYDYEIYLE